MEKLELAKKMDKELQIKQEMPVVLTWERAAKKDEYSQHGKIQMYHNCETGVSGTSIEEVVDGAYHMLLSNSRTSYGLNIYYCEEYDVLVLISCTIETNRPTREATKFPKWKEGRKFFIFKDKTILGKNWYSDNWSYVDWGTVTYTLTSAAMYSHANINFDSRFEKKYGYEDPILIKEVSKMFSPVVKLAGNKIGTISTFWALGEFLKYKEPSKKTGPKQKKIDELVSIKLPAFPKKYLKKYSKKNGSAWYYDDNNYAIISKVKEGVCVVRTFKLFKPEDSTPIAVEGGRMYIEGNNLITCRTNNFGEWINIPSNLGSEHWNFKILDIEKGASEGTALRYLESILIEMSTINTKLKGGIVVWALLKYPHIEMIYKSGCKELLANYFSSSYVNPNNFIKEIFGAFDPKKKSLFTMLGINKYQYAKLMSHVDEDLDVYTNGFQRDQIRNKNDWMRHQIRQMKTIFSTDNIADMDNTTYDAFINFMASYFDEMSEKRLNGIYYGDNITSLLQTAVATYGSKSVISSMDSIMKVILNVTQRTSNYWSCNTYKYYENQTSRLYVDYIDMVRQLEDTKNFKLTVRNVEDVKEMHDAVVAIFNMKKNEIKNEAFRESSKRCDKFQYSDENYTIVIPRLAGELANEGVALHHCVGGYVDRVCNGSTNIVFIRKTSDIDTPFFTVEISDDGSIQQIHGSCNRNLSSEPDLEYFVKDWIEKCKLTKTNYNKVR